MGLLVGLSLVGSLMSLIVPGEYIGLLGVIPFVLGFFKLIELTRRGDSPEAGAGSGVSGGRVLGVALVTLANGGDNVGAYVPVFATRTALELIVTVVVFLVMTGVWCLLGHALVSHPRIGPRVRRFAGPIMPLVLIVIGVLIVIESGAYRLITG